MDGTQLTATVPETGNTFRIDIEVKIYAFFNVHYLKAYTFIKHWYYNYKMKNCDRH